jgi:hypothetical protein
VSTSAREPSRLRGLPTFGFATAGLLVGHALSYLVAIPDPHHRDLLLDRTGHDYLPAATEAAIIVALAGVAALLVRAWSARGAAAGERLAPLAATLAVVQVAAFVGQEVLERLLAGVPLAELAHDSVLPVGVVVQVTVALAGAALLRWLSGTSARIVRAVLSRRAATARPALVCIGPPAPDRPVPRVPRCVRSVRAPPSA